MDDEKLAMLERCYWTVQEAVYRAQAAAQSEDMDFAEEWRKVLQKFLEDVAWAKSAAKDDDRLLVNGGLNTDDWRRNWESYAGMIIDDTERLKHDVNDIMEREMAERDEN